MTHPGVPRIARSVLGTAVAALVAVAVPAVAQNAPSLAAVLSAPTPGQPATSPPVAASAATRPTAVTNAGAASTSPSTLLQYQNKGARPPPFGADMFASSTPATTTGIQDPGYVMQPGDDVMLWIGGAVADHTQAEPIDPKGNILVPGVGPVQVAGLSASAVNAAVNRAASSVYSSSVKVYAAPVTALPINVFVTGPVKAPGPYSGGSSDSVISFLQRAGGIDPNRGSYRDVAVLHNGRVVAHIDLYDFLRTGEIIPVRLHQDDVVVVGPQGPVVSVYGAARAPFTFELAENTSVGEELLRYARPEPQTNYAGLLGVRGAKPFNIYLPLSDFARQPLLDGDRVSFNADSVADTISIQVVGAHHGPSSIVVARQTSLATVLAMISLDPMADRRWIHLERVSVANTQKQLLDESLARLEKAIYTQSSSTDSVAQANAAQALSIQLYINSASQLQPAGDLAIPPGQDLSRVSLEADDTIVIPFQSQVVSIGGEVNQAQSLIFQPGASVAAYVTRAGGFTNLADRGHILVIHPDGTTQQSGYVSPGDRILVLTRLPSKWLELAKDLTQVLYQTAIAAVAAKNF